MTNTLRARTGVTAITGEFTESRSLVRRRVASESSSLDQFMLIMQREKFTGDIVIKMAQGGVRAIAAQDEHPIDV